jgi:hypothetical protein
MAARTRIAEVRAVPAFNLIGNCLSVFRLVADEYIAAIPIVDNPL